MNVCGFVEPLALIAICLYKVNAFDIKEVKKRALRKMTGIQHDIRGGNR